MRMSAKAEYAVRAMVQLATIDEGILAKTDDLAKAQGIPPQFLVDILSDLRTDRLVRSHRGRDGGYALARPAEDISIADVLRCIDGPLTSRPARCLNTSRRWPTTTAARRSSAATLSGSDAVEQQRRWCRRAGVAGQPAPDP
jgi:Rrf2 family protein